MEDENVWHPEGKPRNSPLRRGAVLGKAYDWDVGETEDGQILPLLAGGHFTGNAFRIGGSVRLLDEEEAVWPMGLSAAS